MKLILLFMKELFDYLSWKFADFNNKTVIIGLGKEGSY
jgi:hypothetical protein